MIQQQLASSTLVAQTAERRADQAASDHPPAGEPPYEVEAMRGLIDYYIYYPTNFNY